MTLPSPAALFASIVFGVIGWVAFRHGKKYGLWQPLTIGIALMVYPYFIDRTWLLYGVGCALCGALYFLRG